MEGAPKAFGATGRKSSLPKCALNSCLSFGCAAVQIVALVIPGNTNICFLFLTW